MTNTIPPLYGVWIRKKGWMKLTTVDANGNQSMRAYSTMLPCEANRYAKIFRGEVRPIDTQLASGELDILKTKYQVPLGERIKKWFRKG